MEKAFDFKAYGEKLKARGLPIAEEAIEEVYEATKEWLLESAALKGGLVGGVIPVAIGALDGYVKNKINDVDGQPG